MSNKQISGSILSLLFVGLVCRFLKTLEMDVMALRRSFISVLARESAYINKNYKIN